MSIADSTRGLSEEASADFLRNQTLPTKTFTVGLPGIENSWVKRRFMMGKRDAKIQDAFEDFSWSIPDLGAGGEW